MSSNTRSDFSRRRFLTTVAAAGTVAALAPGSQAEPRKGRIKQGICMGVFSGLKLDLDGACREAARLGAWGIDLVGPDAFPVLKKYGLIPTMVSGGSGIEHGINDPVYHAEIERRLRGAIEASAKAGAPNVILLSGERKGISDEAGLDNSVAFLNRVKGYAEDQQITLCMELLNSKVDHPGYMCDSTRWGVELCKRVNSPRVKLLYDIYHMQIMEGDVIRTIRDNIKYIGHFHTAGNPGRHQFDETQELNYSAICKAIAESGFQGFLSHEYSPTRDPIGTLEKMMRICEV
jgi:hydroxypyruvate isomerase